MKRRSGARVPVSVAATVLLLLSGCGDSGSVNSHAYFSIRPINGQSDPPCKAPALPEVQNGRPVHCYQLGPSQVDAADVVSATVVPGGTPGTSSVTYDLSPDGTQQFNALARSLGVGGQLATVVDGTVVNAVKLETTDFPGRGIVSGLAPDAANRLATRLNRH